MDKLDLKRFQVPERAADERRITFDGYMLSVDNAIAKTGWVYVLCRPEGLTPIETGMLEPPDFAKGHKNTLLKAEWQFEVWRSLLNRLTPDLIVHSTPALAIGRMSRPEAGLVSATALRCAARLAGIRVEMVQDQRAKTRLTGNKGAGKPEVGEAVRAMIPAIDSLKPNNEHTRDAMAFAVVASEEHTR